MIRSHGCPVTRAIVVPQIGPHDVPMASALRVVLSVLVDASATRVLWGGTE